MLEWTIERRKSIPLAYKVESFLVRMLNTVAETAFKTKYPPITQSFFVPNYDSDVELISPL